MSGPKDPSAQGEQRAAELTARATAFGDALEAEAAERPLRSPTSTTPGDSEAPARPGSLLPPVPDAVEPAEHPRAWIRWITGEGQGRDTEIVGLMLIGRTKACDICLTDQTVSRDHALIGWDAGRLVLVDHGSQNGSFVNNLRIKQCVLQGGDLVRLGQTRFLIRMGEKQTGASVVWLDNGSHTAMNVEEVMALPAVDDLSLQSLYTAVGVGRSIGAEQRQQLQAQHFAVLFELSQNMQADNDDVEAVLRKVLKKLSEVVGADRAVVARLEDPEQLVPWVVVDPNSTSQEQLQITLLRSAYDRVIKDHTAVRVVDAQSNLHDEPGDAGVFSAVRAAIIVPLLSQAVLIGTVELGAVTNGKSFEDEDTTLVQIAAAMMGTAIERHRLLREKERTIEALKRTQQMLVDAQQLNADLFAVKELNNFARILAHEATNQLTIITSAVDVVQEHLESAPLDDAEVVSDMVTALADITDIVGDFLDIARPDAAGAPRHFTRQSPRGVLHSAVRFARHEKCLRGVRCDIKVETDRRAYIDAPRLRQVLFNLVRNAGHAMRDGQAEAGAAHITLRVCPEEADGICIEVIDNGKGMSPETASRVFERGFTAAGKGGMGVGLTVCERIVKAHDGRIDFDTTLGAGTTFRVHLPGTPPKNSGQSVQSRV